MISLSIHPVRKKWPSPFYSTFWCYIHQTCTNCSCWHDPLMPHGGLWPWPIFHAWVTMVRKKWLSPYYSTYCCYFHQTYTNCSSWHGLLMPHGGLCLWPTFHASVTKTQNGNSRAPMMVPITIMSSFGHNFERYRDFIFGMHTQLIKRFQMTPMSMTLTMTFDLHFLKL